MDITQREDRRLRPRRRGWLALMPLIILAMLMAMLGFISVCDASRMVQVVPICC